MGSKGSSSTTSNQSYLPFGSPLFFNALNRANDASQTPFQNYGGELVAGLSPTQQAGIGQINQNSNFALPYINEAAGFARQGAQSAAPDIGQFLSPYTQNVVDTTQRQFDAGNKIQQSQLVGNARAQSGVGGDRLAIAQSELAKQQNLTQNPIIASLYNSGFGTALSAAQNLRQQQSNAAYGLGSLGTAGQNAQLQGANAQLTAGGLEQGTQQAGDTAAYQQFLRAIGYPFQTSQFLTQATAGLGPSLGGTQNGATTSTPAQPSLLGQIAGLGLTGAGLLTGNPMMALGGAKGATGGGKGAGGGSSFASSGAGGFAHGGAVGPHDILHHALSIADTIRRHRNGGAVLDAMRGPNGVFSVPGFAFGGEPDEIAPNLRVSDAFAAANDAIRSGEFDLQGANAVGDNGFLPRAADNIPLPRPKPMMTGDDDALPPQAEPTAGLAPTGPFNAQPRPPGLAPSEFAPALREAIAASAAPRPAPGFADSPGAALMSAGLGMLASGSPFPGVAIGQGGLKGLSTLEAQRKATREEADASAKNAAQRGSLAAHGISAEQAAQRLFQSAQEHAATLAETTRHHTEAEKLAQKPTLTVTGRDEYGNPTYGIFDPRDQSVKPVPKGTPQLTSPDVAPTSENIPPAVKPPAPPPKQLSDDDSAIPKNAALVSGDDAFLQGLPAEDRTMVKAMVEGRQPPPPGKALSTPFWRRMVQLASQYDPGFDQSRWAARVQTRKNFATGVEGRIVRSLNTVMNHLDELDEAGKALDTFKQSTLGYTKLANEGLTKLREHQGDPRLTRFDTASNAVSTELEKAFRGSQTAISGIREWRKSMSPSMAPEQMKEANKTLAKLLMGQLEGLAGQYNAGMGVNADPLQILQPNAAKTVQKLLGTTPEGATEAKPKGVTTPAPAPEAPAAAQRPASVPEGSQYSPSRKMWRDPSGKIYDAQGNPVQ